ERTGVCRRFHGGARPGTCWSVEARQRTAGDSARRSPWLGERDENTSVDIHDSFGCTCGGTQQYVTRRGTGHRARRRKNPGKSELAGATFRTAIRRSFIEGSTDRRAKDTSRFIPF